jgi:hypothetical protein
MDSMMRGGVVAQMTSSGPALVAQGNRSGSMISPAGIIRGIPFKGNSNEQAFGLEGNLSGRLSLGFLAFLILFVAGTYMWTRNVQGGG